MEKFRPIREKLDPVMEKVKPVTDKAADIIKPVGEKAKPAADKVKPYFVKLSDFIKASPLYKDPKKRKLISILLVIVLVFVSVFGIIGIATRGERINTKKAVKQYNSDVPDTSYMYKGATDAQVHSMIDELDVLAASFLNKANIESYIYSDEVATLLGKVLAKSADKDLSDVKFKALEKNYPEAYSYVSSMQDSGKDWKDLETVPFGIPKGDKDAFIKACGAFAEFLGNDMLSIFLKAPSIYNDALVPALESLHTGEMPTLTGFVFKTGLSGTARVEFIIEKVLSIIEPIKEAPITFACEMLPDFIINYRKACEFINERSLGLELPEIEDILNSAFRLLDMTCEPFDLEYVSSLGTAEVAKSGGNKGKRVEITGDRDAVFLYIANYVLSHLTYENNYPAVEDLLTKTLKKLDRNGEFGKLIYSEDVNKLAAIFIDIVALNKVKTTDAPAEELVNAHNAAGNDHSAVFEGFMSRESVTRVISTLDSTLASFLKDNSIENMLFTDNVATAFTKYTALFCSIDFSEIPFDAMSYSFPEAYAYLRALQDEGKTWDDVETIPFGITAGDKDTFIKACGAGGEYLGDLLALNMLISPSVYDEALVTLTEAFHLGASPDVREFINRHGLDGAKRIEIILELILPALDLLKEAPVSYLCTILPDFIYSYGITADCAAANPDMALTGLEILPLDKLIRKLTEKIGVVVPDYDFNQIVALSTAEVAPSGDRTGKRMELTGDKEAVFAALASYIMSIISYENNVDALSNAASSLLGINAGVVKSLLSVFKLMLG